jgi:putative exosortase-associated protein (TIGR04073 family)
MRSITLVTLFCTTLFLCSPVFAQDAPRSELIVEKMSFKLVRGITNMVTAIAELPKQSYLTVRDRGAIGYVVGPIKGIGMTAYRAFIGAAETIFFLVPQPGYYDPMIDPDYVWKGWEEQRVAQPAQPQNTGTGATPGGAGQ